MKNQLNLDSSHFDGINSITALSFTNSNIKTVDVNAFSTLPNINSIDLSGNTLTALDYLLIPNDLFLLNLESNKLISFKLAKTASVISSLNLNNNQFKSFESMDTSILTNLMYLSLSGNPHSNPQQIFTELKALTSLRSIELNNLAISTLDPSFFERNSNLIKFYLTNNKISVLPYNAFSGSKSLSTLELSYNQISSIDSRTFADLENLSFIYLQNNLLTKFPPKYLKI